MFFSLKKIVFAFTFNLSLFLLLIIGIQNASYKSKVNFIVNETIALPLSFIIGVSFISGSIYGSFINLDFKKSKE